MNDNGRPEQPRIEGEWWTIAGNPDLGELSDPEQQPVDFAIWQASDGSWQLWSCIRHTRCGGRTRLFYRWEGAALTVPDWKPAGIPMQADAERGETPGGLQAPHVARRGDEFFMVYGDWERICLATSRDGKRFLRLAQSSGHTAIFSEGAGANTRDPMLLRIGDRWHCYYTAYPSDLGAVYCRTSPDLVAWSDSVRVAFGGAAGTGRYAAECPHVVARHGAYYLFRTQRYAPDPITRVYWSTNPLRFGLNEDDRYLVAELPIAAPEVVRHEGQDYLAALRPGLDGIRVVRLNWSPG